MLFSRSAEYAIRAMTFLASQPHGKLAGAREISEKEEIPMAFLWKILQALAKRRLVRSFKGKRGGYQLGSPGDRISLSAIVNVTDGAEFRDRCVLGLPKCDNKNPCPLHGQWKEIRTDMAGMLDETSLADLARASHTKRARKRR